MTKNEKLYAERDIMALDDAGNYYFKHVSAMTGEKLHGKSDIAAELAHRDYEIDQLKAQVEILKDAGNDVYAELQQWALQSSHKETDAVFKAWRKARDATPAQCLAARDAEIKAQAGRDGFIAGVNYAHKRTDVVLPKVIEMVAHDYANQLRQQDKDSKL